MSETQRILVAIWNRDLVHVKREDSIALSTGKLAMGEKLDSNYNEIMEPKDFISLCEERFTDWISILKANTGEIIVKVKASRKKMKFENSFEASKFIKEVLEDISINIICNEDIIKPDDFLLVAEEAEFGALETFEVESENLTPYRRKDKLTDNIETILIPTWNRDLVEVSERGSREFGIDPYELRAYKLSKDDSNSIASKDSRSPIAFGFGDGSLSSPSGFITEPEKFIQFCEDHLKKGMSIFRGNNNEIEVAIMLNKFSSPFELNRPTSDDLKEKGFKSALKASEFIINNLNNHRYIGNVIHKGSLVESDIELKGNEEFYNLTAFNIKPESLDLQCSTRNGRVRLKSSNLRNG